MNLKLFGVGVVVFVCFGFFLFSVKPHPRGFSATNISPERVAELYKSNPPESVKELFRIVEALYVYIKDHESYPKSDFLLKLDSLEEDQWIKGIVPTYLQNLPNKAAPHMSDEALFIYKSNGGYFMILARHPDDCLWVKQYFSELLYDPEGECVGFGVWTTHRHK